MAPTAARRAKLVQRNNYQGLRGNRDACHPRRGSACDINAKGMGGNARPISALSVQPTAAMSPRLGGAGGASDRNPAKPPSKKRRVPRGEPPVIERRAESSRPTKKEIPNVQRATTGRPYRI